MDTEKIDREAPVFFGEIDKNKHGNIASDYPAWMHETGIDDMREEINREERTEKMGFAAPADPERAMRLKAKKKRLEAIESSKPKLSDKDKDEIAKYRTKLGERIGETMFTRSEMMTGRGISAHEEAKRMSEPGISLNPKYAKMCNARTSGGKASRDNAVRVWKILGAAIGEPTNTEGLRRDRNDGTYKSVGEDIG